MSTEPDQAHCHRHRHYGTCANTRHGKASDINEAVLQAIASGQVQTGGLAIAPAEVQAAPFVARIKLDDAAIATRLPAGTTGLAAIFTEHVKAAHVIRKVLLRQTAIMNYVNPY